MSDFPSLAEVMKSMPNPIAVGEFEPGYWRSCARWDDIVREVEKAWREACTINTADQLKSCPRGTVVICADGRPLRRWPAEDGEDYWLSGEVALPALLIWSPGWSA